MLDARQLERDALIDAAADARRRTIDLVSDLSDDALLGPRLWNVNPFLWEIGHVAWFHEARALRRDGRASLMVRSDGLYDSIAIPHEVRWDLRLPDRGATLWYLEAVLEKAIQRLQELSPNDAELYYFAYAVYHEDMHDEAFLYTRHTRALPPPRALLRDSAGGIVPGGGPCRGDVEVPGGRFRVGPLPPDGFAFDNEKWGIDVDLASFSIARAPVTQGEFREFVEGGGYRDPTLWTEAGWAWRLARSAEHPIYWRRGENGWERLAFDRARPLEPHLPVCHVSWYEADAFCRWAGRRLPTEAEWETAASLDPVTGEKRYYPWGAAPPDETVALLDARGLEPVEVGAFERGDSATGCRQMIGNVWEWTADWFGPYPEFTPDHYREYSQTSFGSTKVLRGGCHATRSRLIRNTWRNFYEPRRNDVFAGFRTCAV